MSFNHLTRRHFLGTAAAGAAMLAARPSLAASKTLNILSHRVHQTVLQPQGGENLLAEWSKAQDAEAVFSTFDSNPLQDRLFREATSSTIGRHRTSPSCLRRSTTCSLRIRSRLTKTSRLVCVRA
jgi:hypothetical protein